MDPISAALIAAAVAGVTTGATEVGKTLLVDAYTALRDALKSKFGADSKVAKAADELNANPKSDSRRGVVKEEVTAAGVDKDPDLVALANALLEQLKAQPGGASIVQQIAHGDQNIQAAGGSTVTATYGTPPKKDS
jgi:hypothetical protein